MDNINTILSNSIISKLIKNTIPQTDFDNNNADIPNSGIGQTTLSQSESSRLWDFMKIHGRNYRDTGNWSVWNFANGSYDDPQTVSYTIMLEIKKGRRVAKMLFCPQVW